MGLNRKYKHLNAQEKKIKSQDQFQDVAPFITDIICQINKELRSCPSDDAEFLTKLKNRIERNIPLLDTEIKEFYEKTLLCHICYKRIEKLNFVQHVLFNHEKQFILNIQLELAKLNLVTKGLTLTEKQQAKLDAIAERDDQKLQDFINRTVIMPLQNLKTQIRHVKSFDYRDKELISDLGEKINKVKEDPLYKIFVEEQFTQCLIAFEDLKKSMINKMDKLEYIKIYCKVKYVTWDNIRFTEDGISISLNPGYLGFKIKNVRQSLNTIKDGFYKRNFGHEKYKLVFKDNVIILDLSPGLSRLKSLIEYNQRIKNISAHSEPYFRLVSPEMSRYEILQQIQSEWNKNEYLKNCAGLLSPTDKVRAILEYNNLMQEECILFGISTNSGIFVIAENINDDRATYVFYHKLLDVDDLLDIIKDYFENYIENRRQYLSQSHSIYGNNYVIDFSKIIHTDTGSHLTSIKEILNSL